MITCVIEMYLKTRWGERHFEVHWNWRSCPFLFSVRFQELDFSRQLRLFHSSHSFDSILWEKLNFVFRQRFRNQSIQLQQFCITYFQTIAFSEALYFALPFKQINCTPDVFRGVGIFTSIFWPSNDGLKFDLSTTYREKVFEFLPLFSNYSNILISFRILKYFHWTVDLVVFQYHWNHHNRKCYPEPSLYY